MQNCVSKFIESRIEEISQALRKGNGRYALAAESSKLLYDSLEPIVQNEGDISISAGDCLNFREYFEQEFEKGAVPAGLSGLCQAAGNAGAAGGENLTGEAQDSSINDECTAPT